MSRTVQTGGLVRDQCDFYITGGLNRVTGLTASQVDLHIFSNNGILPWPITDGTSVQDSSISAGYVYFNEISDAAGFYSIRFFPDRIGYWRLVLRTNVWVSESIRDFDIVPSSPLGPPNGLNASFL